MTARPVGARTRWARLAALSLPLVWLGCAKEAPETAAAQGDPEMDVAAADLDLEAPATMAQELGPSPAQGYLQAHQQVTRPLDRLGGGVTVRLSQPRGGVYVMVPDKRQRREGVVSPYSDAFTPMINGSLHAELVDRTATDGATTEDRATIEASWEDRYGNVYGVRCCQELISSGSRHPTFGGVVTDHLMNGFTGIGSVDMPSVYAYAAAWGIGEVLKNGEVLQGDVPVQIMLTEYTRTDDFALVDDASVVPGRLQLQLLVAPDDGTTVNTGYELGSDTALPFWFVSFPAYRLDVQRAGS